MVQQRREADERKSILARAIASLVARGRRVESQADYQAIMVRGRPVNHILHLIISFFTGGFWIPVWLGLVIFAGEKREVVEVDEYGQVLTSKL